MKGLRKILAGAAVAYAVAGAVATPRLRHAWWYLQENAMRRHSTFLGLCAASAALPWCLPDAVRAYRNLAARGDARPALPTALVAAVPGQTHARHVDARMLTRGRFRALLEDYAAEHGGCRVWSTGLHDYVFTAGETLPLEKLLREFEDPASFDRFAAARVYAPSDLLSCYVGDVAEVAPALADAPRQGALAGWWKGLRALFRPTPEGADAPLRTIDLTPLAHPAFSWIDPAGVDPEVLAAFSNAVEVAQGARREVLLGHDDAAAGNRTNALARWARAAQASPHDPLLTALADAMDREGRLHVKIGNLAGALHCYENRMEIFPDDVAALHNFGLCLKNAGHPEIAVKAFTRCVVLDPLLDAHRLEMVECAAASGMEDLAVRQLDVLIKRHPEDKELAKRKAKIILHKHLEEQKRHEAREKARAEKEGK